MTTQPKIEDLRQYVIRDKETKELWTTEVYLSISGAKTSYYHANKRRDFLGRYINHKFDDQDKYEIVKVRLVIADE
jgi:hypothetical protein